MRTRLLARAAVGLAILGVGLSSASSALAQAWTPKSQGHRLGGDFDFWPTRGTKTMSWSFFGQIRIVRHVFLDFDVPWAYAFDDPGYDDAFAFGNPTLGAHYGSFLAPNVAFYIGGTVSFPTRLRYGPDAYDSYDVGVRAATMRASFDAHRHYPEYVFVRGRVGLEIRAQPIYLRFDANPVIWVPAGDDVNRAAFVLESGNEFEARARVGVGGGVRLQGVFQPTRSDGPFGGRNRALLPQGDRAQLAVEPFFSFEPPDDGFFARIGLLVAVDPPLGFGFDRGNVATLRVELGGKF